MRTHFVVAPQRSAGDSAVRSRRGVEDVVKVVVLTDERDVRGRTVRDNDTIEVVGTRSAWAARLPHEVEWLINSFNARTLGRTSGQAPLGLSPDRIPYVNPGWNASMTAPPPDPPDPRTGGTIVNDSTSVMKGITARMRIGNGPEFIVETITVDSSVDGEVHYSVEAVDRTTAPKYSEEDRADWADRTSRAEKTAGSLVRDMTALREWLSGVDPVEDPDIPGISYCGVCKVRLPGHASGCPAAPPPAPLPSTSATLIGELAESLRPPAGWWSADHPDVLWTTPTASP